MTSTRKKTTRGRKGPTEEQKAAAEARREAFRNMVAKIADMDDADRMALVSRIGAVVNCEGRPLSMVNTLMLAMQLPTVSMVGGFQQWLTAGRCVMKGQKGLAIWIPCGGTKEDAVPTDADVAGDGTEGKTKRRFIMGTVFDVSQTAPVEAKTDAATPVAEVATVDDVPVPVEGMMIVCPDCGCETPSTAACFVCGKV